MSVSISRLSTTSPNFDGQLRQLLSRETESGVDVSAVVLDIIRDVRLRGDAAVLDFTSKFDRLQVENISELIVPHEQMRDAFNELSSEQSDALRKAAERVRHYHEKQMSESWSFSEPNGNQFGQKVTPLERVGIYVPGGKAAYPSSVLMNAIPARVAGVNEIVMVVPSPEGNLNPMVLAAAYVAQVDRVITIGGAQAIAALAYGTASIPAVDKIVGPGNKYVAMAKQLVFGVVGIDMIAGPSEVLIVGDGTANPDWLAMDLFAQAEHDEDAQSILVTTDEVELLAVQSSIDRLIDQMSRKATIKASLEKHGAFIKVGNISEAIDVANRVASEHLELAVENPERLLGDIKHAGAIFMGHYSAEALGDYCAGPNHVLPTSGTARFSSPLGVYDFQKRSSIIHCSKQGAAELASIASVLARAEGLSAHAQSADYRSQNSKA